MIPRNRPESANERGKGLWVTSRWVAATLVAVLLGAVAMALLLTPAPCICRQSARDRPGQAPQKVVVSSPVNRSKPAPQRQPVAPTTTAPSVAPVAPATSAPTPAVTPPRPANSQSTQPGPRQPNPTRRPPVLAR